MPRKTKIISTLGPASESPEMLRALINKGVNIFRLNMSHAKHEWVREVVKTIRGLSTEMKICVSILMDTQGPAIRTGDLAAKLQLKAGDVFTFTVRGERSEELYSVDTNYDDLISDINVGDIVLVDNGVIRMKVLRKDEKKLVCEVLTSGEMGSRRHINLPGVKVNLPALTEKDLADVELGCELKVDWIALSFVREAKDVEQLRQVLLEKGADIKIVAKIEDQLAVKNLDEIINAADGVMVARGDLGIECPYEELPIIQRRIVKTCIQNVKPVIVATHMLESMIANPIPTRAEITDVSNAVFEQADAIMLSGETTVGKYPRECVEVLDRVAERIERSGNAGYTEGIKFDTDHEQIVATGVSLAEKVRAKGVVVFTRRGVMAQVAAGLRPRFCPIFAFTSNERLVCKLNLLYAVKPFHIEFHDNPDLTVAAAEFLLKDSGYVQSGDKLVLITDLRKAGQVIDSVQLRIVS